MIETKQVKKSVDSEQRDLAWSRMSELDRLADRGRPGDDDVPEMVAPIARWKTQNIGGMVLPEELSIQAAQLAVTAEAQRKPPIGVGKAGLDLRQTRGGEEDLSQSRGLHGDRNGLDDLDPARHAGTPTKHVNIDIII